MRNPSGTKNDPRVRPGSIPLGVRPALLALRFLKLRYLAFYPARAQSAEADGARARNRTG